MHSTLESPEALFLRISENHQRFLWYLYRHL